jgi:hypothetical protein
MKKFIVLSLIGLSILAFGAIGYAQAPVFPYFLPDQISTEKPPVLEFKASGFIDVISNYNKNVNEAAPSAWTGSTPLFGVSPQFSPQNARGNIAAGPLAQVPYGAAFNKKQAFMDTRGRLRFDAIMAKQVTGTFFFEIDATRWGERNGLGAQRNQAGNWNADSAAIEVKNMFITFAVPPIVPVPIDIQAGILPWITRPVCNYTDGSGMNITFKPDPAMIKLTWMKALENQDWASDDADVYGIEARVKVQTVTIGGYMAYYNMNTYPFQGSGSFSNTATPLGFTGTSTGTNTGYNSTPIANQTADMSWWGLYADGKVGPVNINFDFAYDTGKVEAHGATTVTNLAASDRTVDYNGWITRLKVDFPWEKFNFGVIGMYASGSDMKKTSATGLPGVTVAYGTSALRNSNTWGYSQKVGGYIVPPNAENGYDDESIVFYGQGANGIGRPGTGFGAMGFAGGAGVGRGVYGGTWFAKLYGSYKATPWYKVTLYGMYIGDTTKNGNTIGDAVNCDGTPRNDSTIGWEFDIFNDIQIYKNLQFRFGGGVLIAGKAFDMWDARTSTHSRENVSPANPYQIITKLIYVF